MHPTTLSTLDQVDLASLRDGERRIKVLLAGTQTPRYGHPRLEQAFGVRSRVALLNSVRDRQGKNLLVGESFRQIAIVKQDLKNLSSFIGVVAGM